MARRTDAEIVKDLKQEIREKQERAARKDTPLIVKLDDLIHALGECVNSSTFDEAEAKTFVAAQDVIRKRRDALLDAWIKKNG